MTRVNWTEQAEFDVDEIMLLIAEDNPRAAVRVVRDIHATAEQLTVFPMLGRVGRVEGTRELVVLRTPYVMAYRFLSDEVTLLHVFHGARLWPDEL
ncbi:MAG TPA: type II toxin-antitoxin system RelE/ParE family toxin [Polyangiaceae bacterium]|nr:type II toxin-antitoxin system RelE/ParE family toxin [Polyangiaceae bacterium]